MFFYSNEVQVGKFEVEKLVNVARPHLKSLPLNCYMSRNKNLYKKLSNTWKLSCTNVKFDLKVVTLTKNFLWHTWNLKLSTTWKTSFAHFFKLQRCNLQQLEKSLPHIFSNFNVESFNNLENTLPHLRTYNTLKKFLPHLLLTWKSCKLLVCHCLEMNSHSLRKVKKTLLSKWFFFFLCKYNIKTLHYFLF
jgi:hypothetical protein